MKFQYLLYFILIFIFGTSCVDSSRISNSDLKKLVDTSDLIVKLKVIQTDTFRYDEYNIINHDTKGRLLYKYKGELKTLDTSFVKDTFYIIHYIKYQGKLDNYKYPRFLVAFLDNSKTSGFLSLHPPSKKYIGYKETISGKGVYKYSRKLIRRIEKYL